MSLEVSHSWLVRVPLPPWDKAGRQPRREVTDRCGLGLDGSNWSRIAQHADIFYQ